MTKDEARDLIRQRKRQFTGDELGKLSLDIIRKLEQNVHFANAKTILLYYSLPDEVCTHTLIEKIGGRKTVLLPRVIGDGEMELRRYTSVNDLRKGTFGIMEPCGEPFTDYANIDLAVIPGMAFDRLGNRLGRGKGYYDRFLSRTRNIHKVGICFPFQLIQNIPTDTNDVRMNEIIS